MTTNDPEDVAGQIREATAMARTLQKQVTTMLGFHKSGIAVPPVEVASAQERGDQLADKIDDLLCTGLHPLAHDNLLATQGRLQQWRAVIGEVATETTDGQAVDDEQEDDNVDDMETGGDVGKSRVMELVADMTVTWLPSDEAEQYIQYSPDLNELSIGMDVLPIDRAIRYWTAQSGLPEDLVAEAVRVTCAVELVARIADVANAMWVDALPEDLARAMWGPASLYMALMGATAIDAAIAKRLEEVSP